jgi:hypothetical protein
VDTFKEAGVVPGEDAEFPAEGGARYCRKDTWLLSCLFYKADISDELTVGLARYCSQRHPTHLNSRFLISLASSDLPINIYQA